MYVTHDYLPISSPLQRTNNKLRTNYKLQTNYEQTNEQTIISSLHTTIKLFTTVAYPHITINMSTTVRSIDDAMMKKITDIVNRLPQIQVGEAMLLAGFSNDEIADTVLRSMIESILPATNPSLESTPPPPSKSNSILTTPSFSSLSELTSSPSLSSSSKSKSDKKNGIEAIT